MPKLAFKFFNSYKMDLVSKCLQQNPSEQKHILLHDCLGFPPPQKKNLKNPKF